MGFDFKNALFVSPLQMKSRLIIFWANLLCSTLLYVCSRLIDKVKCWFCLLVGLRLVWTEIKLGVKNIPFLEFAKAQRIEAREKIADKPFLNNIFIKYDGYVFENTFLHGAENNFLDH